MSLMLFPVKQHGVINDNTKLSIQYI